MPTYSTPTPIDLAIHLPVGAIDVVAGDRTDTVVTVTPTNPAKAVDRRGAEETKVDFDGQRLTITGPKPRLSWIGPTRVGRRRVELPAGSRLTAEISIGRRAHRRAPRRHPHQGSMGPVRRRHHRRPVAARRARQRDRGHRRRRRPRSPPTTGRSGSARSPATRSSRRRTAPSQSASPAATSTPSSPTATSRSPRRSARSPRRPRTAASSCTRSRAGPSRSRAATARSPSACGPASRPGSTCRRRAATSATSSRATVAPDESEQSVAVRARTQAGDITVQRAR